MFEIGDEELHKIREQFALFDEDRSGSITINELGNIYKALGHHFTEKELLEMMRSNTHLGVVAHMVKLNLIYDFSLNLEL